MGEPTATAPSPGAAEQAREKKPAAGAANDDRYAAFLSRARTTKAQDLILLHIYNAVAQWEGHTGTRQRQRLSALGPFVETLERFVGDLLRARTGKDATGRIYHSLGKMSFDDDPVTYDHFMRALEALKALDLIAQSKSHRRYTKAFGKSFSRPGRAPRFWATDKLVGLARQCGITDDNVHDHFRPELPTNVLVLRDYSPGRGANRPGPADPGTDHPPHGPGCELQS